MKNLPVTFLLTILLFSCAQKPTIKNDNRNVTEDYQNVIKDFISIVKSKNKLSNKILYPLKRENPIPSITTKKEFLDRYDQVFDDKFKQEIINSNPAKDWSTVGSRGIMFNNGALWIDFSGNLFAVNNISAEEQKMIAALNSNDKSDLHPSISKFEKPVMEFETTKYRIRVDNLGSYNYRYASWPIAAAKNSKPDLLLEKGEYIPEGSGGNHRLVFKNGAYRYEIFVIRLGANDSPPAILYVYNGTQLLMEEDAKNFKN